MFHTRVCLLASAIAASASILVSCGGGTSTAQGTTAYPEVTGQLDLNDPLERWAYDPSAVSHETFSTPPPGATTFQLLAGQTIDVGEVSAWSDGDTLFVRYLVDTNPWWLSGCHLNIGISSSTASFGGFDDNGGPSQPAWNFAIAKAAFQMAI